MYILIYMHIMYIFYVRNITKLDEMIQLSGVSFPGSSQLRPVEISQSCQLKIPFFEFCRTQFG